MFNKRPFIIQNFKEIGGDKMKPIFICYNKYLKKYLCEHGEISWCKGINEKSGSKFWVFMNSEKLNKLIENYNEK